ncbi:MAG: hypothetical protein JOS17DRAFT_791441 [Linnemannia elongata]|nr:MAG: hypothetical protein JOS17DRAFT_791441 [Linnemannia elongata]
MTISIRMESELGPPLPPYQQAVPQRHKQTFARRCAKRLFIVLISLTALFLTTELYHLDKSKLPTNWRFPFSSSSPSSPSSSSITPSSAPPQAPLEARLGHNKDYIHVNDIRQSLNRTKLKEIESETGARLELEKSFIITDPYPSFTGDPETIPPNSPTPRACPRDQHLPRQRRTQYA